jgi:hypothetical protein
MTATSLADDDEFLNIFGNCGTGGCKAGGKVLVAKADAVKRKSIVLLDHRHGM